ncbi:MAG: hypothetical protein AAF664_00595 [Planctomycetota bacterium]
MTISLLTSGCTSSTPDIDTTQNPGTQPNDDTSAMREELPAASPVPGGYERDELGPISASDANLAPPQRVDTAGTYDPSTPAYPNASPPFDRVEPDQSESTTSKLKSLSVEERVSRIRAADEDMQKILQQRAGITDGVQARKTLLEVIDGKKQASLSLIDDARLSESERAIGYRGLLQSYSHLASLQDARAAKQLEELAGSLLETGPKEVHVDAAMIMLGLASEQVSLGNQGAVARLTDHADQLIEVTDSNNLPALLALLRSIEMLGAQDQTDSARELSVATVDRFAATQDPYIAQVVTDLATSIRYDRLLQIIESWLANQGELQDLRTATANALEEHPDLVSVRFLAGSASQLEAARHSDAARAIYVEIDKRLNSLSKEAQLEFDTAASAFATRQALLNTRIELPPLDLDGSDASLTPGNARIYVIPFWSLTLPPSYEIFPTLDQAISQFDDVEILAVNLDSSDLLADARLVAREFGIRSLQRASDRSVAARFGVTTAPFMIVADSQMTVISVAYNNRQVQEVLENTLSKSP